MASEKSVITKPAQEFIETSGHETVYVDEYVDGVLDPEKERTMKLPFPCIA